MAARPRPTSRGDWGRTLPPVSPLPMPSTSASPSPSIISPAPPPPVPFASSTSKSSQSLPLKTSWPTSFDAVSQPELSLPSLSLPLPSDALLDWSSCSSDSDWSAPHKLAASRPPRCPRQWIACRAVVASNPPTDCSLAEYTARELPDLDVFIRRLLPALFSKPSQDTHLSRPDHLRTPPRSAPPPITSFATSTSSAAFQRQVSPVSSPKPRSGRVQGKLPATDYNSSLPRCSQSRTRASKRTTSGGLTSPPASRSADFTERDRLSALRRSLSARPAGRQHKTNSLASSYNASPSASMPLPEEYTRQKSPRVTWRISNLQSQRLASLDLPPPKPRKSKSRHARMNSKQTKDAQSSLHDYHSQNYVIVILLQKSVLVERIICLAQAMFATSSQ